MSTYYPQEDAYEFVDFQTLERQAYQTADNEQARASSEQQAYAMRQLDDLRTANLGF